MSISPFARQMMVAVSPQLAALSVGGSIVYPTLLLQQLKNESFIDMDVNISSWIGSIYGISGIPVILMPMLMQWKGRKICYIITCFFVIIGWVLTLAANSVGMILTSESFHGFATNSLLPVSCMSMTEMLSPKYRFISMQIFGINITLGVAVAGILGRFLHYKTVSLIMLIPALVAVVIAFFWPESPAWLACKGKFDQCKKTFIWLRGTDDQSIKEMQELIKAQTETMIHSQDKDRLTWHTFWKTMMQRDFYMPAFQIYILLNMIYWSGGDVIATYFVQMVEKSTRNDDAAFHASIVMYSMLFLGAIVTNFTVRRFNNKTVLIISSLGCLANLIAVCIVTFLQRKGTIAEDSLLCMYFLIAFMLFYSLGLNAVVFFIAAELMPVKHRSIGGALYIIFNCGLYASTLKISPYLLLYNMSGTFLIYAINLLICIFYVWKYVPETKGKSLQEVEEFYRHGKFRQSINNYDCERPLTCQDLELS